MLIKSLLSKIFRARKFSNDTILLNSKTITRETEGNQSKESENAANECWKLSRLPHEKAPFIINCLKLEQNSMFGRFIVTSANLRPGEVIAVEEPIFKFFDCRAIPSTNQLSPSCGPLSGE